MRYFGFSVLAVAFMSISSIQAGNPVNYIWVRLLSQYDFNRDQQLSTRELGSYWGVIGKYDFNRNGQLTKKEFEEKRIPPAIKK